MRLDKVFLYLFKKLTLLGDALAAIMRLLAMDEVMMKMKRVVGPNRFLVHQVHRCVSKDMRGGMVDDHHRASGRGNRNEGVGKFCLLEELAQMRNFFYIQIVPVRPPEGGLPRTDHEGELLVAVRFDFADLRDRVDDFVPAEIAREFPPEQAVKQKSVLMANMWTHALRVALGDADCWSDLLSRSPLQLRFF